MQFFDANIWDEKSEQNQSRIEILAAEYKTVTMGIVFQLGVIRVQYHCITPRPITVYDYIFSSRISISSRRRRDNIWFGLVRAMDVRTSSSSRRYEIVSNQ